MPSSSEIERLRSNPVRETPLMKTRQREAAKENRKLRIRQQWVDLEKISRPAITAVLSSEDARFFSHDGLDLTELNNAIHDSLSEGRSLRGASTLTQQVAKNIFLSEDRSFMRKAREAIIAWRIEKTVPKKRILRLYLNIAEWGDGIFGIEAAAQAYLQKHASQLTLAEGAAFASMLPNPHRYSPSRPAQLHRRANHVLDRIQADRAANKEEIAQARQELDRWLKPSPVADTKPSEKAGSPEDPAEGEQTDEDAESEAE